MVPRSSAELSPIQDAPKYPILKQYLVPHPSNTIDLATLGATAVVSQHISVVLEIVHRGVPIRCKVIIGIMILCLALS